MKKGLIYFVITLALSPTGLFAQQKQYLYQMNRLLIDSNYIFSYGRKNINNSNKNTSKDGFEHDANFCLARYSPKGKKQWEVIINKNRDFIQNSAMVKHGSSYFVLLEFMTRKVEEGIFFNTLYFVNLDSSGAITSERRIKDSIFYGFNHVYFDNQFIYVTLRTNQLVCEKYDYNFKLIETITNPLVTSFFYDAPNDDMQTHSGIVNVGPYVDVEAINALTKIKAPIPYEAQTERFIKRIDKKLDKATKVELIPLPKNKIIALLPQPNGIYCIIQDLFDQKSCKIFKYDEKLYKLNLIKDSEINNSLPALYFHAVNDKEFLLYGYQDPNYNSRSSDRYSLTYIKDGKVLTHTELKKIDEEHFSSDFRVTGGKLYIYETNTFGGDIIVRIWDYKKNAFVE